MLPAGALRAQSHSTRIWNPRQRAPYIYVQTPDQLPKMADMLHVVMDCRG